MGRIEFRMLRYGIDMRYTECNDRTSTHINQIYDLRTIVYGGRVRMYGKRGGYYGYPRLQTRRKHKDALEHGKQIISNKAKYPSCSDKWYSTLRGYTSHIDE